MLANNPAHSHTSFSGFTQTVQQNPEVFLSLHVKLVATTNRQRGGQKQETYPHPQNHPAAKTLFRFPRTGQPSILSRLILLSRVFYLLISSPSPLSDPSKLPLSSLSVSASLHPVGVWKEARCW